MIFFLAWCAGLIAGLAPAFFYAHAAASKNPALSENFYGVEILGNDVWIVGYYGTILRSSDRGATWEIQSSPTRNALFKARFLDRSTGWINGAYGTILHTIDGGKTWRPQPSGTQEHLLGCFWLDRSRGWFVGSRGVILRTEDGGRSWQSLTVPGDLTFNDVAFVNPMEGWLAGEFGAIFRTRDGGTSWLKQKSPIEVSFASGESRNLFALLFTSPTSGYGFGLDGVILRTRDATRWEIVRQEAKIHHRASANHLFAAAQSNGRLWAVGERGALLESDSRGDRWSPSAAHIPPVSLNGIAFGESGLGLVVGNRGLLLRSDDGGISWRRWPIAVRQAKKDQQAP